MKRVKAVLFLELALLAAVWPPFWWALLAPRRLLFQMPGFLQPVCQASLYMMLLDTVPGLLGLWALRNTDWALRRKAAYRLAVMLCVLHTVAGGLLLGLFLVIELVILFFRIVN